MSRQVAYYVTPAPVPQPSLTTTSDPWGPIRLPGNHIRPQGSGLAASGQLVGIAADEVSHAYQDAEGSRVYRVRRTVAEPLARVSPWSGFFFIGGFWFGVPVLMGLSVAPRQHAAWQRDRAGSYGSTHRVDGIELAGRLVCVGIVFLGGSEATIDTVSTIGMTASDAHIGMWTTSVSSMFTPTNPRITPSPTFRYRTRPARSARPK